MEDPLAGLSEEDRKEAEHLARIAEQAEKRAAERLAAKQALLMNNTNTINPTPNGILPSSSSSSPTTVNLPSTAYSLPYTSSTSSTSTALPLPPPKRNILCAPGSALVPSLANNTVVTYLSKAERDAHRLTNTREEEVIPLPTTKNKDNLPNTLHHHHHHHYPSGSSSSSSSSVVRTRSRSRSPPSRSSLPTSSSSSSSSIRSSVVPPLRSNTTSTTNIAPVYGINDGYVLTSAMKQEIEQSKTRYLSSTNTNIAIHNPNKQTSKGGGVVITSSQHRGGKPNPRGDWDPSEDTSNNSYDILYERSSIDKHRSTSTIHNNSTTNPHPFSFSSSQRYPSSSNVSSSSSSSRRRYDKEEEEAAAAYPSNKALLKSSDTFIPPSIRNNPSLTNNSSSSSTKLFPNEKEDIHWTQKSLNDMTKRDWRIFCEDYNIIIKDQHHYANLHPLRSWDECDLDPDIRKAIDDMKYKEPSPIQRATIPIGIAGPDLIGIAETGSGKTASFLIPLLHHVMSQSLALRSRVHEMGPLALIMAPTRELAQQIEEECRKIAKYCGIQSVAIVGGNNISEQALRLRQGCEIVIGTPGRLIDCIGQSFLVLHQCRYVVLDEADRMIDLGFENQLNQILDAMTVSSYHHAGDDGGALASTLPETEDIGGEQVSTRRTTHMFTATMPPSVEKLAKKYLKRPVTVRIGDDDSGGKNRRITQELIFLANEVKKNEKLYQLLKSSPRPLIIFMNAKKSCDILNRDLEHRGYYPAVLHSGKVQEQREEALHNFKSGTTDILIATDVAGRGLDIPNVAQVINYDMTSEIDRYTHRIGRTGRAGKSGSAITFLTNDDNAILPALRTYLESTNQPIPPELDRRISAGGGGGGGKGGGGGRGDNHHPMEFD